ncbi:MAG TPA: fumarylacetoacetate hydrolase family protein [Burkholderiaceae bacterium]
MKLATLKDGTRDGQLVVVSRDLSTAHYATGIAGRLQQALDDWNFISPQLQDLYDTLNHGKARHAFAFDPALCLAPLPRPAGWFGALAYTSHIERLAQAGQMALPQHLKSRPLLAPGDATAFHGAHDLLPGALASHGLDFGAQLAVVSGDIPAGSPPAQALEGVRLLLLANDTTLRTLLPAELAAAHGLLQCRPATSFSPVAVTPDELGPAWERGRVALALQTSWNGRKVGLADAAAGMQFHFGQLLAHLAAQRPVRAGTVLGSGPVSHPDTATGYHAIAEKRALEQLADGQPTTGWLQPGDSLRIEMKGRDGQSVFGAIAQTVGAL